MLDLFSWWYGPGWVGVFTSIKRRLVGLSHMFSTDTLVRTLFSPWRRITTAPGAGLSEKIRAMGDNLVSRAIGFTVRLFVLFTATLAIILLAAVGLVEIVAWPLLPLAGVALLIKGVL
ncbi:MAG TPA: hypothetical protein VLF69_00300 [Candidatus Saccharimonadales bacterium]|nr:hypothetical protein [Candidatus Saccharimonadales bacterium]